MIPKQIIMEVPIVVAEEAAGNYSHGCNCAFKSFKNYSGGSTCEFENLKRKYSKDCIPAATGRLAQEIVSEVFLSARAHLAQLLEIFF